MEPTMKKDAQLMLQKYISLPQRLQQEARDFIDFLANKYKGEKQSSASRLRKSHFGSAKGRIVMKSDFDAPLEDFRDYM